MAASTKTMDIYVKEANVTGGILADLNNDAFRAIALGQNSFNLAPGLSNQFEAPRVCSN